MHQQVNEVQSAHHFTVDVEEYFQVSAFEPFVERSSWEARPTRLEVGLEVLLELLAARETVGTFFTLGWVAERHPDLMREVARAGHEVASHGWDHRRVTHLEPDEFREDVRRSKAVLEDLIGAPVLGYRAPSYSIVPGREWALDILVEEGFRYDSSLFPVRRKGYGYPGGRREPHWLERPSGRLYELPPATIERFGKTLPAAGGGYFRLLPYSLTKSALEDANRRGVPGMFYIHPWELDPNQPRLAVDLKTRIRHYGRLGSVKARLERLLTEFRFTSIGATLPAEVLP